MKKIAVLFFTILLVQNSNAQQYYIDEKGNVIEKGKVSLTVNEITFREAKPMKDNTNEIIVKTINGYHISTSSKLEKRKCYHLFEVIESKDSSLLGKPVICQVIDIRKSNISGSEGRLILRPLYVENGTQQVPIVPNDIYRRGLNRTNAKFWLSFLVIPIFVAGSCAEILPDERIVLTLNR